jgi:hypothetical protein
MNSPAGSRHHGSAKQKAAFRRKASRRENAHKEEKMTGDDASSGRFFSFTIDADTAQIVKFEALDASGARHEVSDEEKQTLAHEPCEAGLEEALERAFEAGIACVLGEEGAQAGAEETEDEDEDEDDETAELRHLLLMPLIKHSALRRLMRREALNRAILETLIQHSIEPPPAEAGSNTTAGTQPDRTASARTN